MTRKMRVTQKGAGKISTGLHSAINGDICFAAGETFECPDDVAELYETRGIAKPANDDSVPLSAAASLRDEEAIRRLAARGHYSAESGCLLWLGSKVQGGYGQITYRRMSWRTHRLAWVAHHGPVPDGMYVCHACDNPACMAIEHLFLGTPRENYFDMRSKGRHRFNAKLTEAQVVEIRRRIAGGETAVSVARDFSVRYGQIIAIKNGQAWKD